MTKPVPPPFETALRKCYGKRRFCAMKDARQATTRLMRTAGTQSWPYYCDICLAYHLTSQDPKAQKAMRKRQREREG